MRWRVLYLKDINWTPVYHTTQIPTSLLKSKLSSSLWWDRFDLFWHEHDYLKILHYIIHTEPELTQRDYPACTMAQSYKSLPIATNLHVDKRVLHPNLHHISPTNTFKILFPTTKCYSIILELCFLMAATQLIHTLHFLTLCLLYSLKKKFKLPTYF